MHIRRNALFATFVGFAIAASVGCSAAPLGEEATASTEQAVGGKCPFGTSPVLDVNGNLMCVHNAPPGPPSFTQVTNPPLSEAAARAAGSFVTCGDTGISVPPPIAGHGCTTGVAFDGGVVWACPAGTNVPCDISMFGAIACGMEPAWKSLPCEDVYSTPIVTATNCFGTPKSTGWILIVDRYRAPGDLSSHAASGCPTGGCCKM